MHDFGKMVFAFSVFWVYMVFAQYIVIWYGDMPVETFFIVQRVHHMPWSPLSVACVVLIWLIPFVVLMSVRTKKTPAILGTCRALGLIGMWLERYVLVVPSLSLDAIPFGPTQFLISIGFLGAFLTVARCRVLTASRRPRLRASRLETTPNDQARVQIAIRSPRMRVAIALAIAGCSEKDRPMTTLAPKSDLAQWIQSLYHRGDDLGRADFRDR